MEKSLYVFVFVLFVCFGCFVFEGSSGGGCEHQVLAHSFYIEIRIRNFVGNVAVERKKILKIQHKAKL